jgi:predicted DNA-binding mobile mystery protein A
MEAKSRKLVIQQMDSKIRPFAGLENIPGPGKGWIHAVRTALNMTLSQLAKKMGITQQSLQDFEKREKQGSITVHSLQQVAEALGMKLVYALVPKEGTLEEKLDAKAGEKAKEIVGRTAISMELEDQANEKGRLEQAFLEKKNELKNEIPRFLWD